MIGGVTTAFLGPLGRHLPKPVYACRSLRRSQASETSPGLQPSKPQPVCTCRSYGHDRTTQDIPRSMCTFCFFWTRIIQLRPACASSPSEPCAPAGMICATCGLTTSRRVAGCAPPVHAWLPRRLISSAASARSFARGCARDCPNRIDHGRATVTSTRRWPCGLVV